MSIPSIDLATIQSHTTTQSQPPIKIGASDAKSAYADWYFRVDYQLNRWRSLRFALTVLGAGGLIRTVLGVYARCAQTCRGLFVCT